MSKRLKIILCAVACVMALCIGASTALSVMTFVKVTALTAEKEKEDEAEEGETGEDNVLIGENYMIRSTKEISDAYLSGNTDALSDEDKETLKLASTVIKEVVTASMTPYQKEEAIFLWMNENIRIDDGATVLIAEDTSVDNPHGVLSSHKAVCVGYATTFRLFMEMLEIPCKVVHDTYLAHSWDLVQLDGHWYHVDLYSADGLEEPRVLLNRNDEMLLSQGSEWDRSFFPAADSLEQSFLYQNAKDASDIYAVPKALKTAIEDGSAYISLLIPAQDNTPALAGSLMSTLEDRLMFSVEYGNYSITHAYSETQDGKLLVYMVIDDLSEEEEGNYSYDISDEDYEHIESAINDSFGELTYSEDEDY